MYTLKQARMYKGKTQQQMAECLGVCRDTYRTIESEPEKATIYQAKKISEYLELPFNDIFFGFGST